MTKVMPLLWVSILLLVQNQMLVQGFLACQCSDYGTQPSCQVAECFWNSNNGTCQELQPNCPSLLQIDCVAPGCLWDGTTCSQVIYNTTDFFFLQFNGCASLTGDADLCTTYNCAVAGLGKCSDVSECNGLTEDNCDGITVMGSNSETLCMWDSAATTPSCLPFNGCNTAPLSLCAEFSTICQVNGSLCQYIDCSPLTEANCHSPPCQWFPAVGTTKASCGNLNCSYNSESNCGGDASKDYCAWNGTECFQCFQKGDGVLLKTFFMILSLMLFLTI